MLAARALGTRDLSFVVASRPIVRLLGLRSRPPLVMLDVRYSDLRTRLYHPVGKPMICIPAVRGIGNSRIYTRLPSEYWGRTHGRDGQVGAALESTSWGWWPTRGARKADAPGAGRRGAGVVFAERASSPGRGRPEAGRVESGRERRRPSRLARLEPMAQVFEDPGSDGWLGDGGDDANVAPALGTTAPRSSAGAADASRRRSTPRRSRAPERQRNLVQNLASIDAPRGNGSSNAFTSTIGRWAIRTAYVPRLPNAPRILWNTR